MLHIHNSMTGRKEPFKPIRAGEVRIYVCGITVYDYCHIGHGRMLIVFDLLRRHLRASGYRVTFVRNITDIDDKIIRRAGENGEPVAALTERFIRAYQEDCAALGVEPGDHEPRATEYIPQIIDMVGRLVARGNAYQGDNGDVYFSVASFAPYGRLSGKRIADLRAGARVEVDESKRDPLDFVLWKAAKPGEPAWESPWGPGRPGWHIECSAMSVALLGEQFDIHGGGQDLQFPHHENEIAQSEGALGTDSGKQFVKYWMHNGFVRVDEEKMSKSLGNFFTVRDILKKYDAEVVRFFILRAHYRSPLNYSDAHLEDAKSALTRLYTALKASSQEFFSVDWEEPHAKRFKEAMDDDFGTPEAVSVLFDLATAANTGNAAAAKQLRALGAVLGILQRNAAQFLQGGDADAWVSERIAAREAARQRKDFKAADDIRKELLEKGIILEDKGGKTTWRRK